MKIAYLDCFAGISGDMMLGALVDAGVPISVLEEAVAKLDIGASLSHRQLMRGGLTCTKVDVHCPGDAPAHDHEHSHDHGHTHEHTHEHSHSHEHHHEPATPAAPAHKHSHGEHRALSTILEIIAKAPLSDKVKAQAAKAFQALGEAEAAIHNVPVEKVHFHEVGAVDTIVDIVGSAVGIEALGIEKWIVSPLNVGSGTVRCAHGLLPVPAPATLKLLANAPIYSAGEPMERVTPTGAAILAMIDAHYEAMPVMHTSAIGYGAGGRESHDGANALRLVIGETGPSARAGHEEIAILETVIDDSSPQVLSYASDLLFEAGAWDVYRTLVQMKKGRTGVQLTVLCRPDLVPVMRDILFAETTTIGLRWRIENKEVQSREFVEIQTEYGPVRIKIARWPSGRISNASPEFEDCRLLATVHNLPLKTVMREAMRVYAEANRRVEEK